MIADAAQPGLWTAMEHVALGVAILGNIALAMTAFRKTELRQPVEVREADDFVTKEECVGRHTQLERQLADLRLERHNDATLLHEKVNEVGRRVAGLDSETKQQNAWLQRMDTKLDLLSRRI